MRRKNSTLLIVVSRFSDFGRWCLWLFLCTSLVHSVLAWIAVRADARGIAPEFSWRTLIHVMAFIVAAWLLEKMFPLKAIDPIDWIYKVRPLKQFKLDRLDALIQCVVCALLGLIIGAANDHLIIYMVIAVVSRLVVLFHGNLTLPTLLEAGKAKVIGRACGVILDSEIVHQAFTITHMRWFSFPPTASYALLVGRRLARQPLLLALGGEIILVASSLAETLPAESLIFLLLSASVLSEPLARCADFTKLSGSHLPKYILLFIYSVIVAYMMGVIVPFDRPLFFCLPVIFAIIWCGVVRSRNRTVDRLRFIESGVVGAFSPEILGFYLSGLALPLIVSLVLAVNVK